MDNLQEQELIELRDFFVNNGWIDGLFQVLFVIEGVKPGMYLQYGNNKPYLKQLKNIFSWFGLYTSIRHGGYTTKNKALYNEWNRIFGFKMDVHKFLGYPECCVRYVVGFGGNLCLYQLYSLFKGIRNGKRNIAEFREFLSHLAFIHHSPCQFNCRQTYQDSEKFKAIAIKYRWLAENQIQENIRREGSGLIQMINSLKEYTSERTEFDIQQLQERNLVDLLHMNLDDIREIGNNKKAARLNIAFGIRLMKANWNYMFIGI